MKQSKSSKFLAEERKLKDKVIKELRKHLTNEITEIEKFEDEARNTITGIDKNNVYFDGLSESYPLSELGLLDAIYLLGYFE
jgi:hypothetical protein